MALYNRAEKFFRTMGSPSDALDAVPRQKFKFFVKFIANSSGSGSELSMGSFPLAVSVELPRVDFETQIVNQYNRKRVVQTGFNYAPINLIFYDTVDKSFQTFYQKYFFYYYNDRTNADSTLLTNDTHLDDQQGHFGYSPPEASQDKNFFKQIIVYRGWDDNMNNEPLDPIILYNPVINSIMHDTLTYTESQPVTWTMSVVFENVMYKTRDNDDGGPDDGINVFTDIFGL
jgi:hypothetical protein